MISSYCISFYEVTHYYKGKLAFTLNANVQVLAADVSFKLV